MVSLGCYTLATIDEQAGQTVEVHSPCNAASVSSERRRAFHWMLTVACGKLDSVGTLPPGRPSQ